MFNVRAYKLASDCTVFAAGFQQTFANGLKVSVQFGSTNYCDNKDTDCPENGRLVDCNTAEVAVMDTNNKDKFVVGWPHSSDYDQVAGWLTAKQVLAVMNWAESADPANLNYEVKYWSDEDKEDNED